MSNGTSSSSSGIGVLGLLGVAFVVLKLTGYIDWSWWYVTLPFWGGIALILGVLFIWFIGGFVIVKLGSFGSMVINWVRNLFHFRKKTQRDGKKLK